jgi:hypothetical protein
LPSPTSLSSFFPLALPSPPSIYLLPNHPQAFLQWGGLTLYNIRCFLEKVCSAPLLLLRFISKPCALCCTLES